MIIRFAHILISSSDQGKNARETDVQAGQAWAVRID